MVCDIVMFCLSRRFGSCRYVQSSHWIPNSKTPHQTLVIHGDAAVIPKDCWPDRSMALTFPQLWVHLWLLGRRYLPPLEHLQQSPSPTELWAWFCSMLQVVVSRRSLNIVRKNCVCFIDALQLFHARKEGFYKMMAKIEETFIQTRWKPAVFQPFETFENLAMKSKGTRDITWPKSATWKLQGAGLQLLWGRPALWALDAKVEGLVPWRGADVGSGQKNTPPRSLAASFSLKSYQNPNRKKDPPPRTIFQGRAV